MEVRLAQSRLSAAAFLLGIDKHQLLLVCAISTSWLKGLSVRAGAYESERLGMNADVSTAEHRHQTAFTFLLDLTHMSLLLLVGSSFLPCFSSASWFTNNFPSLLHCFQNRGSPASLFQNAVFPKLQSKTSNEWQGHHLCVLQLVVQAVSGHRSWGIRPCGNLYSALVLPHNVKAAHQMCTFHKLPVNFSL